MADNDGAPVSGRPDTQKSAKQGSTFSKWFTIAAIFIVSAFVLHGVFVLIALATGMVSPDNLLAVAGPVTFILEFSLAAVITWLIVRPRKAVNAPTDEMTRKAEAFLVSEHRREEEAEQAKHDHERFMQLSTELDRWRQVREARARVTEALAALGDGDAQTPQGTSLREELTWALTYIDSVDPMNAPPAQE